MTDIYTQENGSKKKFLAPVLVILLCMVSLTAAGYAYSATVTNTDDPVIIDGVTLGLYEKDGTTLVDDPVIALDFSYGTHTTNGKAIKYGTPGVGFDKFVSPATEPAGVSAFTPGTSSLADFAPGFYVETFYKIGAGAEIPAGYHPVAAANEIDSIAKLDALKDNVTETKGVVGLGEYKLIAGNATGGKVDVTFAADYDTNPVLLDGVRDIILVFEATIVGDSTTDDDNAVCKIISLKSADVATQTIATLWGADVNVTFTVNAYMIVSDWYSATQPAIENATSNLTMFFGAGTVA